MPNVSDKPTVLVISAGFEQQRLLEQVAKVAGRLVVIHPSQIQVDYVVPDRFEVVDVRNVNRILEIAREENIDAVVSDQCDYSWFACAFVCDALGLKGASLDVAQCVTNKWLQRTRISEHGIKQPEYTLCYHLQDALDFADQFGFPVVVKPVDSRGSQGVSIVKDAASLAQAVRYAMAHAVSFLCIVEEYIDGQQIVVDGYFSQQSGYHPLVVSSKEMHKNAPVASAIVTPPQVTPSDLEAIFKYDQQIIAALGINFGCTHSEYMLTRDGEVYLIEVANRGGGVMIGSEYVPAVSGIDTTAQLVCDALGQDVDYFEIGKRPENPFGRIHFLIAPQDKTQCSLNGLSCEDGIRAIWVKEQAGLLVGDVCTDLDRLGVVIMASETKDQADKLLEKLQKDISYI